MSTDRPLTDSERILRLEEAIVDIYPDSLRSSAIEDIEGRILARRLAERDASTAPHADIETAVDVDIRVISDCECGEDPPPPGATIAAYEEKRSAAADCAECGEVLDGPILCVIESPYGSSDPEERHRNRRYARALMRHCLIDLGFVPFASHALYTQPGVLDDGDEAERKVGMEAGIALVAAAGMRVAVIGTDLGESTGMSWGIKQHEAAGMYLIHVELGDDWDSTSLADGEWMGQ